MPKTSKLRHTAYLTLMRNHDALFLAGVIFCKNCKDLPEDLRPAAMSGWMSHALVRIATRFDEWWSFGLLLSLAGNAAWRENLHAEQRRSQLPFADRDTFSLVTTNVRPRDYHVVCYKRSAPVKIVNAYLERWTCERHGIQPSKTDSVLISAGKDIISPVVEGLFWETYAVTKTTREQLHVLKTLGPEAAEAIDRVTLMP